MFLLVDINDLEGTIDGKTILPIIKKILKEVSVPIQLGGGIRSIEYTKELLNLNIERELKILKALKNYLKNTVHI